MHPQFYANTSTIENFDIFGKIPYSKFTCFCNFSKLNRLKRLLDNLYLAQHLQMAATPANRIKSHKKTIKCYYYTYRSNLQEKARHNFFLFSSRLCHSLYSFLLTAKNKILRGMDCWESLGDKNTVERQLWFNK